MNKLVTLNGIMYRVTEIDGQVIFDEVGGIFGVKTMFCFEWTGAGWYLVDFEATYHGVCARHLVSAVEWLEKNYTICYNDGVGATKFVG